MRDISIVPYWGAIWVNGLCMLLDASGARSLAYRLLAAADELDPPRMTGVEL